MCPEFLNEISNFDIVCINETKTDSTDDLEIDGVMCQGMNANVICAI